jgi:ribosomal protein L11 methyltransferase
MAQAYLEYRFTINPKSPWEDILLAQLQQLPFDSFLSTDEGLNAYLPKTQKEDNFLDSIALLDHDKVEIEFTVTEIPLKIGMQNGNLNFNPSLLEVIV